MNDFKNLKKIIKKKKLTFFCGVPDSVLKRFTKELKNKIITANEGSAIALAAGYYLSTNKIGTVFMQNSGIGNAINPISSIIHKNVYSIPMLLIIGWRGSPNSNDEPQHQVKGEITLNLLKLLKINHLILKKTTPITKLSNFIKNLETKKKISAIIVPFEKEKIKKKIKPKNINIKKNKLLRSDVLISILKNVNMKDRIISSTGYVSRELLQLRKLHNLKNGRDFYLVGGMGHTSMVTYGASFGFRSSLICIDGDGSAIMHLGSLTNLGLSNKKNIKYILLNNSSHESVGGQPTLANKINFELISKSFGFKKYFLQKNIKGLDKNIKKFLKTNGPAFFEFKIQTGTLKNLMRPKDLLQIKNNFMKK